MKTFRQKVFLALGVLFVALGAIGTLLPIIPTVPFLLLAAACFDRSSPKFHHALVNHVHFGPLIRDFYAGKGIPRRAKRISLGMIWGSCVFSLVVIPTTGVKVVLVLIFSAVTLYLLHLKDSDPMSPDQRVGDVLSMQSAPQGEEES